MTLLLQYWIDCTLIALMVPSPDAIAFVAGRDVAIMFKADSIVPNISNPDYFGVLKIVRWLCPAVIFSLCIMVAVCLFYKRILQKSLNTLNMGINKISKQELNFSLETDAEDELGLLIRAFEGMRKELASTFETLWRTEENKRSLYRAFAHDLRTPLTVIKGSNDNIKHIAAKNHDWSLAIRAVVLSSQAVERMERYAEQLKELEDMENWQPEGGSADLEEVCEVIRQQSNILSKSSKKEINISCQAAGFIHMDSYTLLRIMDNLIANAQQYAEKRIWVTFLEGSQSESCGVTISVCDDGPGFLQSSIKRAVDPFYTTDQVGGHLGIGLTISQMLLSRSGSQLIIENCRLGGACVSFFIARTDI